MCLPAARQISIGLRTQRDPSGGVGVSLSHQALRLLENWSHTKTVVPDEAKRVARGGADATRRLVAVIVRGRSTGLSGHRLPALSGRLATAHLAARSDTIRAAERRWKRHAPPWPRRSENSPRKRGRPPKMPWSWTPFSSPASG